MNSTTIKKFSYTVEDIEKLIQADIESKLNMKGLPKFGKVNFRVENG